MYKMKKLIFFLVMVCLSPVANIFAQEEAMKSETSGYRKNEISVDFSSLAFARIPHFTYERMLDEEMGFGIRALYNPTVWVDSGMSTSFVGPYFRWYFFGRSTPEKRYASGMFVELNSALGHMKQELVRRYSNGKEYQYVFGGGMGLGLGYKYVNSKGWSFQIYMAGGRSLSDADVGYFIPAIALGKRF